MKYHVVRVFPVLVLAALFFTNIETDPVLRSSILSRARGAELSSACLGDNEVSTNIRLLSSAQRVSQQQSAQRRLIDDANKSNECRSRIIGALMRAMDKPVSDLRVDRSGFYLWHYGSEILANLKAEESLDLLIEHFDLDDGTPFPLNHHPAVVSVIRMGAIAIPKLDVVLRQSTKPNTMQYADFSIASIGGPDARRALGEALPSESNNCVRSFITASLDSLDSASLQIAADRRTKWYAAFLCDSP